MHNFKRTLNILLLGIFLLSLPSIAQSQKDSIEYMLNINLSGRQISGTFSQLVAAGGINGSAQFKNWHLENKTSYRYNSTNERLIEDNWYELVTLKYYPKGNKRLFPGVFYHFDNNLIYRVEARHHYGIGVGSNLDKGNMQLSILAAVANENSIYNGSEFVNSDLDFANRKNGLFLFKINNGFAFVNKKINISYQLFYFQSLKEVSDFDLWVTPQISFKVLNSLSIHIIYEYRYENVHLEALSDFNSFLIFGVNYSLKSS